MQQQDDGQAHEEEHEVEEVTRRVGTRALENRAARDGLDEPLTEAASPSSWECDTIASPKSRWNWTPIVVKRPCKKQKYSELLIYDLTPKMLHSDSCKD